MITIYHSMFIYSQASITIFHLTLPTCNLVCCILNISVNSFKSPVFYLNSICNILLHVSYLKTHILSPVAINSLYVGNIENCESAHSLISKSLSKNKQSSIHQQYILSCRETGKRKRERDLHAVHL